MLEQTDLLEQVRPLANQIALALVREQLEAAATSLNGASAEMPLGPDLSPPAASNGSEATPEPSRSAEAQTKACTRCGDAKPAEAFDRHRGVCRVCRREQVQLRSRRRKAEQEAEAHPFPG